MHAHVEGMGGCQVSCHTIVVICNQQNKSHDNRIELITHL